MVSVDRNKLVPHLDEYLEYLGSKRNDDNVRLLRNEQEDYKRDVAKSAAEVLDCDNWVEENIGKGHIADCAVKAIQKNQNLVGRFQVTAFLNTVREDLVASERILFDLYHERDEKGCFERICELFGRKYDLVSYLYFILDPNKYLPLRPSIFDEIFRKLDIDLKMAGNCSWDNYQAFIQTVSEVKDIMREYYKTDDIDLIDAHSFLWSLNYDEAKEIKNDGYNHPQKDPEVDSVVSHKDFGEGKIIKINEENVYVEFDIGVRIFPYPKAFEKEYLILI